MSIIVLFFTLDTERRRRQETAYIIDIVNRIRIA